MLQVYKEAVQAELTLARAAGASAEAAVESQVTTLQVEAAAMTQRAAAAESRVAEVMAEGLRLKQEMEMRLSEVGNLNCTGGLKGSGRGAGRPPGMTGKLNTVERAT
jgi:hypothetical protein